MSRRRAGLRAAVRCRGLAVAVCVCVCVCVRAHTVCTQKSGAARKREVDRVAGGSSGLARRYPTSRRHPLHLYIETLQGLGEPCTTHTRATRGRGLGLQPFCDTSPDDACFSSVWWRAKALLPSWPRRAWVSRQPYQRRGQRAAQPLPRQHRTGKAKAGQASASSTGGAVNQS